MAKKPADFAYETATVSRQTQIFYDSRSYSAFPHVIRLEGDELLIAFRQAPRREIVQHTHPRSIITVIRSYDLGQTWQNEDAAQLAAGGGQELSMVYLGKGQVGGALAAHEVVPAKEANRAGIFHTNAREYPFSNVGGLWCWSDNHGLTWRVENAILFAGGMQCCAPPVQLADGTLLIPVYGAIGRATRSSSVLYASTDGGQRWSERAVMARGRPQTRDYHEPAVLELAPSHLLGRTWTRPQRTTIRSGACPRLLKLRDGRLLLTYGRRFEPFGLYASLSTDDGQTWGATSWLLRPTPDGDQGYTSSIELDDGQIFTASYARNSRNITGITGTFWRLP